MCLYILFFVLFLLRQMVVSTICNIIIEEKYSFAQSTSLTLRTSTHLTNMFLQHSQKPFPL